MSLASVFLVIIQPKIITHNDFMFISSHVQTAKTK